LKDYFDNINPNIFQTQNIDILNTINEIVQNEILTFVFDNDNDVFNDYLSATDNLKRTLFIKSTQNKKMSAFLENIFQKIKIQLNTGVLLRKSNFFEIIKFMDKSEIDKEVIEKLDYVYQILGQKAQ